MSEIKFEFVGLDEIINKLDTLGQGSEIEKLDRELITGASNKAKSIIKTKFQKSDDNTKSGKKGYRPSGHFVDNIPETAIKKTSKGMYLTLGEKKDNGEYFYTKFPNFGTSKQPPNFAFEYAYEVAQKYLNEIGIRRFEELLQRALD